MGCDNNPISRFGRLPYSLRCAQFLVKGSNQQFMATDLFWRASSCWWQYLFEIEMIDLQYILSWSLIQLCMIGVVPGKSWWTLSIKAENMTGNLRGLQVYYFSDVLFSSFFFSFRGASQEKYLDYV
jgi:hypothetical protein